MTSLPVSPAERQTSPLGTVSVIPWAGDPASEETGKPFLMLYPLGDGRDGPEGSAGAMATLLSGTGLRVGGDLVDLAEQPRVPVSLLVEAGQAVLALSSMKAQCPVPPEWERAARAAGEVYFICTVRPWPEAVPGRPVDAYALRAYAGDPSLLESSVHCLLPVGSLR